MQGQSQLILSAHCWLQGYFGVSGPDAPHDVNAENPVPETAEASYPKCKEEINMQLSRWKTSKLPVTICKSNLINTDLNMYTGDKNSS